MSELRPLLHEALTRNTSLMRELEALGRLSRSVAHDVNNILTLITHHSDQVLRRLPPGDPARANLDGVKRAVEWGATLARRLLTQDTGAAGAAPLDLNRVVRNLMPILTPLLGGHIELVTRLAPDLGPVSASPGQIEQVIMNLVLNARDAMPDGGRLTIETATAGGGSDGNGKASCAVLVVADTGEGMDAATQARVFEPYFTTKAPGQGSGLGLAVASEIIRRHGGRIAVGSEPGRGSTFTIYLPQVAPDPGFAEPVAPAPQELETVLVVEHEGSVRELVRDVLELYKYTVMDARDAVEALELVERYDGAIDLAIVDVAVEDMAVAELVRRLSRSRPGLKVLYLSGYLEDDADLPVGPHVLQKPFTVSALAARVREVLDLPPGNG